VFGLSFTSSLEKYLSAEDIFGEDLAMLEYHTKTNPYLMKSLFELTYIMAEKIFGAYTDGADRTKKLQMLGCEWTRLAFELYRRNKGYSWGMLFWMLNDCWPAASGWAMIDYYACPKPSYYAFKRCAKQLMATISDSDGKLVMHICNDSLASVQGSASLYIYNVETGEERSIAEIKFAIGENSSKNVFECQYESLKDTMCEKDIILCDLYSTLGEDRAMLIPRRFADLGIKYCDPIVLSESDDELTVSTEAFIPYTMLDLPYLLSDNCFILKKGESKTIKKIKKL
jgi:beta-mannosidase